MNVFLIVKRFTPYLKIKNFCRLSTKFFVKQSFFLSIKDPRYFTQIYRYIKAKLAKQAKPINQNMAKYLQFPLIWKQFCWKKRKRNCKSLPDLPLPIGKLENKNNSTKISEISNNILDFETIFCGLFSKKCPPFCKFSGGWMPLLSALAKLLVTLKH